MTTAKIKMGVKSNVSKYLLEKLPFLSERSPKNIIHKHKIFFLVFLRQKSFLKLS